MSDPLVHHVYLVSSREGLYVVPPDAPPRLLRPGKYFGLARTRQRWYAFRYTGDKNVPTPTGVLESFQFDDATQEIADLREEATALDNGSHQLAIYRDKLYLLETYFQQIRVFHIDPVTGHLTLHRVVCPTDAPGRRVVNAHYLQHLDRTTHTCEGYLHMNALTVQDNLLYVSCPRLRNAVDAKGHPSHHVLPHLIRVYTLDLEPLWEFTLPTEYFCHDLVFHGHHLYFTSPPNKLCRFDIVQKTTTVVATFPACQYPRGFALHPDGTFHVGVRTPGHVFRGLLSSPTSPPTRISFPRHVEPCCILNTSLAHDFAHTNSPLRAPFVHQVPLQDIPFLMTYHSTLQRWATTVFAHASQWAQLPVPQERSDSRKRPSTQPYDLPEILDPPPEVFADITQYQSSPHRKIPLAILPSTPERDALWKEFQQWRHEEIEQKHRLSVTGQLYWYPPDHHLGWHTNLEDPNNIRSYRAYAVFVTQDNQSFFLYRHPVSHALHAVPDRHATCNLFCLGTPRKPLWHAVINPSTTTQRLSLGLAFGTHQTKLFPSFLEQKHTLT